MLKERNSLANPIEKLIAPEQRAMQELMEESEAMNFAQADQAPAEELNRLIWKSVRGVDSELPPTPRGPQSLRGAYKPDDDDE